jgi:hypothetical protein
MALLEILARASICNSAGYGRRLDPVLAGARVLRDPLPGIWLMGAPGRVPAAGLPPYSVEGRAISRHRLAERVVA